MTQKEKIAAAIVEVEYKIARLYNEMNTPAEKRIVFPIPFFTGPASKEEFIKVATSNEAHNFIGRKSVSGLKTEYDVLRRTFLSIWDKYVNFVFADTGWYEEMIQNIKSAEENRVTEYYTISRKYFNEINDHLRATIGMDNIGINTMSNRNMSIGFIEKTIDNGTEIRNVLKFGHSFDLFMCNQYYANGEEAFLEMNYGTMGSFNPETDTSRVQLLVLISKYASNLELHNYIKNKMMDFSNEIRTLEKNVEAASKKFETRKNTMAERLPLYDTMFTDIFTVGD